MSASSAVRRSVLAVVVLLLCAVGATGLTVVDAGSVPAQAAVSKGKVRGEVRAGGHDTPRVKVAWFDRDWNYLGARSFTRGSYSLTLRPGTYHLQFTDLRPAYDVTRYMPQDVTVRISPGRYTTRSVRMHRGAAIGGTVKTPDGRAGGARVVAALPDERSYETVADSQGNFALGGLPPGNYSVFTYDRRGRWAGPSSYLRHRKAGSYSGLTIRLRQPTGKLRVDVSLGQEFYNGRAYLTAVSRSTGQFWTARTRGGSVTFTGLVPGRYRITVPGLGNYFGKTAAPRAKVHSGRTAFTNVRLTKRGGWVTGQLVDSRDQTSLRGVTVQLVSKSGAVLDTATTGKGGAFVLDGQLRTQSGLVVRARAEQDGGYVGPQSHRCRYRQTTSAPFGLTTGRQTALGEVGMNVTPGQSDPSCLESTPESGEPTS